MPAPLPVHMSAAKADDVRLFHGREIRKVPTAAGGMGFVLQLVSATEATDPEGWTPPEREGYDGWGHDARRTWRDGDRLESEGCAACLAHLFFGGALAVPAHRNARATHRRGASRCRVLDNTAKGV